MPKKPNSPNDNGIPTAKVGNHVVITKQPNGENIVTHVEEEIKFAFEMKNAARVMRNSANAIEDNPSTHWELKAFIHGAISLSYAYLEASYNEIVHLHALTKDSPLDESERKLIYTLTTENLDPRKESHVLGKFNMLLRIIGKKEFNAGEAPLQNANLVRLLRNMIIHPVPGRVTTFTENPDFDFSSQQEIVKKLRSALKLDKSSTFPKDIITKKCATWAVRNCETYLHKFVERSGIDVGFISDPNWKQNSTSSGSN